MAASVGDLKPMTGGITPVSDQERLQRIAKAQRLMRENDIGAMIVEAGTSMFYYTGVNWRQSERTFGFVLPAGGEMVWVCPKFEENRARELVHFGNDILTWEEDESPYRLFAGILEKSGARGKVGIEERVRSFIVDGIRKEVPHLEYCSADPVTIGCRSVKSPVEIALMQRSNDITVAAYKATIAMIREGMTKEDFTKDSVGVYAALGVEGRIGANFGEQSALPHGSSKPRTLREGDVILMDGGCGVEGYRSDISRTIVFGKPTKKQLEVFSLQRAGQTAAFSAARPGVSHESLDAVMRKVLTDAGYGPGYKLPGCPHRLGHGIGLDGHEWTYLVKGNKAPIVPGMCFTNEPTIVVPGEFGVRVEDDMYITEDGAKWFTRPSPSIDQPFAQ